VALDFASLRRQVREHPLLTDLARAELPAGYVVGGFIRDALLGLPARDADIVFEGDFEAALAKVAELADARPFTLGDRYQTHRIILGENTLDISPLVYGDRRVDLFRRDFTVNALALPIAKLTEERLAEHLLDESGGLADLESRRIVAICEQNLRDDPVRILRAFRFSVQLGFSIEDTTLRLLEIHGYELPLAAPERIREELMLMLNCPRAYEGISEMEKTRVLSALFPSIELMRDVEQNEYHHLPLLEHTLECVREFEYLLTSWEGIRAELRQLLAEHFAEVVSPPGSRAALTKLALLFHDLGKPATRETQRDGKVTFYGHQELSARMAAPILERLRLSHREQELMRLLIEEHLRIGFYCNESELTPRLIYRFERKLGDAVVMSAMHALADARATRGPAAGGDFLKRHEDVVNEILWHHYFAEETVRPVALLDGDEIMRLTGLAEGPLIGELKEKLLEAQVEGIVRTREEAERFISEHPLPDVRAG